MPSMFRSPNDPSSSSVDPSDEGHVSRGDAGYHGNPAPENPSGIIASSSVHQAPKDLARVASGSSIRLSKLNNDQAQAMLYISLLHGVCRNEALKTLNARRGPEDKLSEDDAEVSILAEQIYSQLPPGVAQNVDLPDDLKAGSQAANLRTEYLNGFSSLVGSVAALTLDGIEPLASSREAALRSTNFISSGVHGRIGAPSLAFTNSQPQTSPHQFLTMSVSQAPFANTKSHYESDYHEMELLGKGGYGQVYKCRNHLDNQEYAIKKILITSQRLQKSLEKNQVEALLAEVRTLAKLNHTNITRYYHGWVETTSANLSIDSSSTRRVETLETIPSNYDTYDDDSKLDISDSMMPNDFDPVMEFGGGQGMQQLLEEAQDREDYEDDVVFGYTSRSEHSPLRNRRASHATTSSGRTLRTSMLSVGEEDDGDIETIPRAPIEDRHSSLSRAGRVSMQTTAPAEIQPQGQYTGPDVTLFIKMSLHPTTLSAYLSPDESLPVDTETIRHCFHIDASIGIISSILDGIEYLHSQNIVHRDLKPANIFLSIQQDNPPALEGCVDVMACKQCNVGNDKANFKRIYITPCIGDFGLIAEIEASTDAGTAAGQQTFGPSLLAALQPKPVGTHFYRPATMPKEEPRICPKLDVYSLGVIALELVHKFGTKSERAMVLTALNKGVLPKDFGTHEMAEGIKGMVCEDRDKRWDCAKVREWLGELQ